MNWQLLTKLNPIHGEPQRYEFQFPDGEIRCPKTWNYLVVEVVEWLWEADYLKKTDCPIKRPNAPIRYLVHTEPRHSNGNRFSEPEMVGGSCVGDYLVSGGVKMNFKRWHYRTVYQGRFILPPFPVPSRLRCPLWVISSPPTRPMDWGTPSFRGRTAKAALPPSEPPAGVEPHTGWPTIRL